MDHVLPALNSQDLKRIMSVLQIFAEETNSYMNGDIASNANQGGYMIEPEESVRKEEISLPISSQPNVMTVNIDLSMVLNASNVQITLELKTETQDALETNAYFSKSKKLMEHVRTAHLEQEPTSCRGTALKSLIDLAALTVKFMSKL